MQWSRSKPYIKWNDDISKCAEIICKRPTTDRNNWKKLGEAYIQTSTNEQAEKKLWIRFSLNYYSYLYNVLEVRRILTLIAGWFISAFWPLINFFMSLWNFLAFCGLKFCEFSKLGRMKSSLMTYGIRWPCDLEFHIRSIK